MAKHLDKDKIESALKRAAQAAVSGNREDRSGKFNPRNVTAGRIMTDKHSEKTNPKR
jgi:hypothetical protein